MKKLIFFRKLSQLFFLSLFIYILWSTTYPLKGVFSPKVLFEADPLIMLFTSISERVIIPGLFVAVGMLILTLIFGRFFCGWMCPMGTMIDIAGKVRKPRKGMKDATKKALRFPKFVILYAIFLFALFGVQAAWILDPIVIIARVISLSVIPAVTVAVNWLFVSSITKFELYGGFYDFYRELKDGLLGINIYFFDNSLFTFIFFIIACLVSIIFSRAWCRSVCPLGALYSLVARFSLLKRWVKECTNCGICRKDCRMGAIKQDNDYVQGECILCMDCVYQCRKGKTTFAFSPSPYPVGQGLDPKRQSSLDEKGLTRRGFLFLMVASVPIVGMADLLLRKLKVRAKVLRPPGVLDSEKFEDECVRCGNCMKVCITNGLQPLFLQEGPESLWTPQLVPEIGYCEYNCKLCSDVCPTGAIPQLSLSEKQKVPIGTAKVDHSICIPWAYHENCLVCEEHCPVADKAIKVDSIVVNGKTILRPVVDKSLCIGCGICQNKCPVRPQRAIRVYK